MKLFRNNNLTEIFEMDDDLILQEFANSDEFKNKYRDEKVRLAMFISYDQPRGLQSTFLGNPFEKLWNYWLCNKWQFLVKS